MAWEKLWVQIPASPYIFLFTGIFNKTNFLFHLMEIIIKELVETVQKLHDPIKGCPADKVRPLKDVIFKLKEEVNEVINAFERNDFNNLKEEIGDVLINIIHISEIAKKEKLFDLSSSLIEAKNKLVRRHPHVWGTRVCKTAEEAEAIWQEMKQKEKLGLIKF